MATAIFEQLINGAMMGSIYVLMALGMVLIFGVMQVLNFAHGVLFMIGGYFAHLFFFHVTGSYPLSVIFSMLSLALIGIVLERAIFRALRQNLPMQIVASLGLILIIQNGVVTQINMSISGTFAISGFGFQIVDAGLDYTATANEYEIFGTFTLSDVFSASVQ